MANNIASISDVAFPNYSTAGGYVPGQVESTGGGYDPKANQLESYTQAPNYTVVGGYDPSAIGSTGGGYDPDNPSYGNQSNSIGGAPAISQNYDVAPSFAGGYYGEQTEKGGGGYDPSIQGLSEPSNARLAASGIKAGGESSNPAATPNASFQTNPGAGNANMDDDWRVRISLADKANYFYNDPSGTNALMMPLKKTNGVIFPYIPSISVTHTAQYSGTALTHSNYSQQFYNSSEVSDITITGDFTVQNIDEGKYLMAAVYFFRAATKMFFGNGNNVGNPPPIVFLDGYGNHYFPHVPCVISGFTHTLSPDVDYIEIPMSNAITSSTPAGQPTINTPPFASVPTSMFGTTGYNGSTAPNFSQPSTRAATSAPTQVTTKSRVPTTSSISITLKPVYGRKNLHDRFDLNKFASGGLLRDKVGGYGGFL